MGGNLAEMSGPSGPFTGGAWLSSARVVRCWVKSRNERNPRSMLPARNGGGAWGDAGANSGGGRGLMGDGRGQLGGRWGRRQIIMPLMSWASRMLQWPVQRVAIL